MEKIQTESKAAAGKVIEDLKIEEMIEAEVAKRMEGQGKETLIVNKVQGTEEMILKKVKEVQKEERN